MISRGHEVTVTVKKVESAIQLLALYKIPYTISGIRGSTFLKKAASQISHDLDILDIVRNKKIDIGIGSSITLAHVSRISKMKSLIFDDDDDEVEPLMVKYGHPFAHYIISPDALKGKRKKKTTIYYPGYHELAYLHPSRFISDPSVLEESGLSNGEPYFIMRFNAFKAHHDVGMRGLSLEQKLILVKLLSRYGKVFITSENQIEPELEPFRLVISPSKIHSMMSYAKMFVGDSQTMSSESAMLGIPSIRCNSFKDRISYLRELETKYELTYSFTPDDFTSLTQKIEELLSNNRISADWKLKKDRMLREKIDVSSFMIWLVENYPDSIELLKKRSAQLYSEF